jgi:hypothetical protein
VKQLIEEGLFKVEVVEVVELELELEEEEEKEEEEVANNLNLVLNVAQYLQMLFNLLNMFLQHILVRMSNVLNVVKSFKRLLL